MGGNGMAFASFFLTFFVCHPDRSATGFCPFQESLGVEWRDPEKVSFAMPFKAFSPDCQWQHADV